MPHLARMIAMAALVVSGTTLAAPQASAHGWHRHHQHGWRHHHHVSRAPLFGWGQHCHLRRFVTYYGALAYRQVCH